MPIERGAEGWRGTNNDVATYAHGIVKIMKVRELKSGKIAITVRSL